MNGTFFPNGNFSQNISAGDNYANEQSYIENILRLNKGKKVKAYFSFPDSTDWRDKTFEGIIEQAGKDHLVMSDPTTGKWELILLIYLNFVEFEEPINYNYPYTK